MGGGIIGCSLAYHLAKYGNQSILLLERSKITHGATWHAAGLVGQLRHNKNLTRLGQDSARLYRELEKQVGVGWKVPCDTRFSFHASQEVGSLRLASSLDRWTELKKSYGTACGFGFEMELLSPEQAKECVFLVSTT